MFRSPERVNGRPPPLPLHAPLPCLTTLWRTTPTNRKNVDITDPDGKQKVMSVVDILHKQACRVVVDPTPEPETPVANFLDELRAIDSLHFDE